MAFRRILCVVSLLSLYLISHNLPPAFLKLISHPHVHQPVQLLGPHMQQVSLFLGAIPILPYYKECHWVSLLGWSSPREAFLGVHQRSESFFLSVLIVCGTASVAALQYYLVTDYFLVFLSLKIISLWIKTLSLTTMPVSCMEKIVLTCYWEAKWNALPPDSYFSGLTRD